MAKGEKVKDKHGEPVRVKRKKGMFMYIDADGFVRQFKPKRRKR